MEDVEKKILEYIEISPEVRDYVAEERFRKGEDSGRSMTDVLLDCRVILMEELTAFGILTLDPDEFLLDGYRCECLAFLREFFDEDLLREFFCKMRDLDKEKFKLLLDDGDPEAEFGLKGVIEFLLYLNPNNKKLQHIQYYCYNFIVVKEFYNRMWTTLLSSRTHEPDDPHVHIEVMDYLKHKFEHLKHVRGAAQYLKRLDFGHSVDFVELESRLSLHDGDLIYGDELKEVVAMRAIRKQSEPDKSMMKMATDQIMCHYKRSRHHMDFFVGQEEKLTPVDVIEILADIFDEQATKKDYLADMEAIMVKVDINDHMKETLRHHAASFNIWSDVHIVGG